MSADGIPKTLFERMAEAQRLTDDPPADPLVEQAARELFRQYCDDSNMAVEDVIELAVKRGVALAQERQVAWMLRNAAPNAEKLP